MLKLTPVFDPSLKQKLSKEDLDIIVMKFESLIWDNAGVSSAPISIFSDKMVDDMGNEYHSYVGLVTGRAVIKGERWVFTTAGHAVSFDGFLQAAEDAYRAAGRA